jgi:hypothetical protein
MPIVGELARWGYEWAWSSPRAGEQIDIGAIFRLAPGLIGRASGVPAAGTVELTVTDCNRTGGPAAYALTLSEAAATIEERGEPGADATVSGTEAAWIKALSPARDRSALTVSGDGRLAEALLDALAPAIAEAAAAAAAVA